MKTEVIDIVEKLVKELIDHDDELLTQDRLNYHTTFTTKVLGFTDEETEQTIREIECRIPFHMPMGEEMIVA